MGYDQEYIQELTKDLTKKELREINKLSDKEIAKIKSSCNSNGDSLSKEDIEAISRSLREALKEIRVLNKLKYTPKKYRKNNKLFDSVL